MKILLISNSARGHAIADALKRSPQKPEIIAICSNKDPGMMALASEHHHMDIMGFAKIIEIAQQVKPDLAFIAPDDPIGGGLADRLWACGIPTVGPKKMLARIESSKSFTRELVKKYNIGGNPRFKTFGRMLSKRDLERELLRTIDEYHNQYVVKYDALKGGKGVKVSGEHLMSPEAGMRYAMECIDECGSAVIEEKLIGMEFSLMSFVSGTQVVDMPVVQDHKRAYEHDEGPNTGGMGTVTDSNHSLPFLRDNEVKAASDMNKAIADALMKECGEPYKGILYGGFIATKDGVKLIEYNARFGDPEALNVLPILETDFVEICKAITTGTLTQEMVRFAPKATVCKYITPKGYPEKKGEKGKEVIVSAEIPENVRVYYGDITTDDAGHLLLGTSRAIGVVGIADTMADAEQAAEDICRRIDGPVRYRKDIGTVDVMEKRVNAMNRLRA